MAHFAKLDENNVVIDVVVVNNDDINNLEFPDSEPVGIDFLNNLFGHSDWKQTSYNNNFRKIYAGIGYIYDPIKDIFIPPKPYASFIFDENAYEWVAPVQHPKYEDPTDDRDYYWDEDQLNWILAS